MITNRDRVLITLGGVIIALFGFFAFGLIVIFGRQFTFIALTAPIPFLGLYVWSLWIIVNTPRLMKVMVEEYYKLKLETEQI